MRKLTTAAALGNTLERLSLVTGRILHLRGWHRVPRLLSILGLAVPTAGIDMPGHRLPVISAIPSAEFVALVNRSLATLLKRGVK